MSFMLNVALIWQFMAVVRSFYSQAQIGKKEIGGMLESAKGKQGSNDPKDECGRNDVESLHVLV